MVGRVVGDGRWEDGTYFVVVNGSHGGEKREIFGESFVWNDRQWLTVFGN